MVTIEQFRDLAIGDVFYRGSVRYAIEAIEHRTDSSLGYPVPKATARTMTKTSTRRRGQIVIQKGYVTFLGLTRFDVHKIVKKDKVRGTRAYKSRKDYPFLPVIDLTDLERSEKNDCTVRALSLMLDIPYADAHAYMQSYGRKNGQGSMVFRAYSAKGLRYIPNTNNVSFGNLLKSGILPARAIVRTENKQNGHVFAVVNGTVRDYSRIGKNRKVKGWYVNENA